jgi:alkanesulfonate monooxygenase SsuD/methylene tetrahydromethanopterin reductase-like flavin-dependent oxidoreductase (luciferase family)
VPVHGDAVRFGVHTGQQFRGFAEALELWTRAEAAGYDWVSGFDHFRPGAGGPGGPCFEGLTLLSALAARTERVRCAILVLAVPYRHPAVVAAAAATIDHVSGGRLELGLGAGGGDLGNEQYGLPFPPTGERLDMLDEACHVVRGLLTQDVTSFAGRHYRLEDARLAPKPLQARVPLVIGGAGERRTLRIVAEHADIWNTMAGDAGAYRRLAGVLAGHCEAAGRDPADIRRSVMFRAVVRETEAEARADAGDGAWLVAGTPEQCAERLRAYAELGVRDFLLGLRPPIDWQTLELVATRVAPALRG